MNLYSGSTLASLMKPLFWQRMSPMSFWANYQRQLFCCKYAQLICVHVQKRLSKPIKQIMVYSLRPFHYLLPCDLLTGLIFVILLTIILFLSFRFSLLKFCLIYSDGIAS